MSPDSSDRQRDWPFVSSGAALTGSRVVVTTTRPPQECPMKKLCLVTVSTLALIVPAAGPAAAAPEAPSLAVGIWCKVFPLLCR